MTAPQTPFQVQPVFQEQAHTTDPTIPSHTQVLVRHTLGPIEVVQYGARTDNYGYLIRDLSTGILAAIDTPDADAEAVTKILERLGLSTLDLILNTHWHGDHTGGNEALKTLYGAKILGPDEVRKANAPLDQVLVPGQQIKIGKTQVQVLDLAGHTLGHIGFYLPEADCVFVGDCLFSLGCGRLFEGTAATMWQSLSRLRALPPQTLIFCAHEYTEANAHFALSLDAEDPLFGLDDHTQALFAARRRGAPTIPARLSDELAFNPMLRAPDLLPHLSPEAAFAEIRKRKDQF